LFKKLLFTTEYFFYYLKKNIIYIVLGLIVGSLAFYQRNNLVKIYQLIGTKRHAFGIEGLYRQDNLPLEISQLISFGLTQASDNDRITNSKLVKELDIQNNNLEYHFTINNQLLWHNGENINSDDIIYPYSGLKISYPASDQLIIELDTLFSPTLSLLTKPLFLKNTLTGLGLYKVTSKTIQEGYIKSLYLQNSETNEKLIYKFYSSEKDLIDAFKLGEVDNINISQIPPEFKSWPNIAINKKINTKKYVAIFLNTNKFADKSIRQALAYATPKTSEKNQRCLGPISPDSWAYNPSIKEYNFNPIRSKELFKPEDNQKNIKMLVTDRELLALAETIRQKWSEILSIQVELSAANQSVNLADYDAIISYGSIPIDPDQFNFWHSTQTQTNITKLNNPRIDKLLEEGRDTSDLIERNKIYQDFQRYLLEESPAIFLEFPLTYTISRVK